MTKSGWAMAPNSLWRETLANFVGRFWIAALGFVCIPIYLQYLGAEAYGIVGFFYVLHATLGVADLGLGITVNREMARLSAQAGGRAEQRDVLRTLEIVHWAMALSVGLLVLLLAPIIAGNWVQADQLSLEAVSSAIRLMGFTIALQLPFAFYQGALYGLRRHNLVNAVVIVGGTVRNGSAVVTVMLIPRLDAFFWSQAAVAILQTALIAFMVWRRLGLKQHYPRFDSDVLRRVWRFSIGMTANALVGVSLTQLDKVILSRVLTLVEFAYYTLANSVSYVLWTIIGPINTVLFPRFSQLVELRDEKGLADLYHTGSQFMAVALLPVSIVMALFSKPLIELWTRNPVVAEHSHVVATMLVIGTALNGLVSVGGQLQAAVGWPQLILYSNIVGAALLLPTLPWASERFGPPGAAAIWLALNAGYMLIMIPVMHTRLLKSELTRWYLQDIGLPLTGCLAVGLSAAALMPPKLPAFGTVALIGLIWLLMTLTSVALAPRVRQRVTLAIWRAREAYGV